MQLPKVPISELAQEGRLTPLVHSIGVLLCVLGLLLGAVFPVLAAEAPAFTVIAGTLGGYSAAVSAWTTYVKARHGNGTAATPGP
jgi:hypothetical protein